MSNVPMTRPEEALSILEPSFEAPSTFIELQDGRILAADHAGDVGTSNFTISDDRGLTWVGPGAAQRQERGRYPGLRSGELVRKRRRRRRRNGLGRSWGSPAVLALGRWGRDVGPTGRRQPGRQGPLHLSRTCFSAHPPGGSYYRSTARWAGGPGRMSRR